MQPRAITRVACLQSYYAPMPAHPRMRAACAIVLLACAASASQSGNLDGAFVYDDRVQILENPSIQAPASLAMAFSRDVWAFTTGPDATASNYWRPVFVAALALEWRSFGADPRAWHVTSVVLHVLATVLAFAWLRSLVRSWSAACAATLLFAVHPVHVESVAWISGVVDPLLAVFTFGTLALAAREAVAPAAWRHVAIAAGTALALLTKEVAVVLPALVASATWVARRDGGASRRHASRSAARAALAPAGVTLAYLIARRGVLGVNVLDVPRGLGWGDLAASAPRVLTFYLRQCLWPHPLGPSYPLRALEVESSSVVDLAAPLALIAAFALLSVALARRDRTVALGALLFALPLLPVLELNAFIDEHVVHDRYLYQPVLGLAVVACAGLAAWLCGITRHGELLVLAGSVVAAIPLALASRDYARAWRSDVALWERGIVSDPGSAANHAELGWSYLQAGRVTEARAMTARALAIRPVATAVLAEARLALLDGRYGAAEAGLRRLIAAQPRNALAYESLAVAFQATGRLDAAAEALTAGAASVPYRRCAFASNLAVVRRLQGRVADSRHALESVRDLVGREPTSACRLVPFHLAALAAEGGDEAKLRTLLDEFLRESRGDPALAQQRAQVERYLTGRRN